MEIVYCGCGSLVIPARSEHGLTNCRRCAHENPVELCKGVMIYDHKTGGQLEVHSAESWREKKKYYVPNGARSALKNFSKSICA